MDDQEENTANAKSLTFWRNWFIGVDSYPDDMRLAWYDAVMRFAFLNVEPESPSSSDPLAAIRWNAVQMVRETIAISRKRKIFGAKGGSKRQAKRKQTPSKTQANAKQTPSKTQANAKQVQEQEQVQEQVQVQVQEQVQEQYANSISATAHARKLQPTVSEFIAMGTVAGVPEEFARRLHADLESVGWTDRDGRPVRANARYLKAAWNAEQKKIRGACEPAGQTLSDIPDAR